MDFLPSADNVISKARSGLNKIGERLSRVTKNQQQLQDEINYFENLEEQVEEDIGSNNPDAVQRETQELEKMDKDIAGKIQKIDQNVYSVLQEEFEDLQLLAKAFNYREQFEAKTKQRIRYLANNHGDFDTHLGQSIQNLERYIEENKDAQGALYRGNAGRYAQSDEGRNWQELAETAAEIRSNMQEVVQRDQSMVEVLEKEERTMEEFRSDWDQTLKDIKELKEELQYYYAEEEELGKIASKLQDSRLMQDVKQSQQNSVQVKHVIQKLDEMIGQIENLFKQMEEEDQNILGLQTNAEEGAEQIKQMAFNAHKQLETVRAIVSGDRYQDLSINSKEKWQKEINAIDQCMDDVKQLVERFEEIEDKEIEIEHQEENILESEFQEGRAAVSDDD